MGTANGVPLVLYHANCNDGFTAAWVAWRHFNGQIESAPAQYEDPIPDVTGRVVYVVDFSWPRKQLEEMHRAAHRLVVLDHHKTAEDELKGLSYCIFDKSMAGSLLTWRYFAQRRYKKTKKKQRRPIIVNYASDHDMWQFALPHSKAVRAWLDSFKRTFQTWNQLNNSLDKEFDSVVREGRAIQRYRDNEVRKAASHTSLVVIGGHRVKITNATSLQSEIGHELAKDMPFGATFFYGSDGKYRYSLRASEESTVDVSAIAKQYGGGGHVKAAGFSSPVML